VDRRAWDERYLEKAPWGTDPNRFLVEAVAGLPPGRALDLACGQGRNSVWLAGLGWEVTAVDWSEVAIDGARRAAELSGVHVEWIVADLEEWRPEAGGFDLVIVVYLQPPVSLRTPAWRMAASAVAPGGRLVVIGHDSANLAEGYGGPQHPDYLYTATEVVATLGDAFTIERAGTMLRPVEADDGVHAAIDNIVVARLPG
jgi:SAM-dependent methyltransferase